MEKSGGAADSVIAAKLKMARVGLAVLLIFAFAACTERPQADPQNTAQVARGKAVYEAHCASCHGSKLEGQPNWRERLPNGKFPAPPHDESGHTWHHADALLFNITKQGIEPYAPADYKSDMPAFRGRLRDEDIWAVIAYIKSSWPQEIREMQAEVTRNAAREGR